MAARPERVEPLELPQAIDQLLEECRMVLPGIQALFGFQLIAVLSSGFPSLPVGLQRLHLTATVLTTIAIALVLAPAAYHRQAYPRAVSDNLLRVSTRLLVAGMWPLAIGICLDLYVVGFVVASADWAGAISLALFAVFVAFWMLFPNARRREERKRGR
jgi:hypothetical protein